MNETPQSFFYPSTQGYRIEVEDNTAAKMRIYTIQELGSTGNVTRSIELPSADYLRLLSAYIDENMSVIVGNEEALLKQLHAIVNFLIY